MAKPRTAYDVTALRKDLEQGEVLPVYVLNGEDSFFRMEAMRLIRERVLEGKDPDLSVVEYEEVPEPAEVFADLRSQGLFASEKLVVLDPADRFVEKHGKTLAEYLKAPSSSSCFVLAVKSFELKKVGLTRTPTGLKAVSCAPLHPKAVPGWLTVRAREYGKRLSSGVGRLMIELAGTGLATLDRHLQNLAAFVGERDSISPEDVAQLVGGDPQRAMWELTSAIVAGDPTRALKILHDMMRHGIEALRVVASLAIAFSRLWRVKRMLRDGKADREILEAIGRQYAFRLRHLKREAGEISPRRLLSAHRRLLDYDLAVKTSAMPNDLLLECMTLELCGEGAARRGA
jgi:DNA polymerase-3 subunit delta